MSILDMVLSIIGYDWYSTEINTITGDVQIVYSIPYIMACLILFVTFWFTMKWITILVKRIAGGRE